MNKKSESELFETKMANVNYFPVIDREKELPVFCSGIGIGHEQEELSLQTSSCRKDKFIHFHMTVSGCGIAHFNGKKHILPIGTMMYTPPDKDIHIMPAPGGWKNNWILINLKNPHDFPLMKLGNEVIIFNPIEQNEMIKIYENVNRSLMKNTLEGRFEAAAESYRMLTMVISSLEAGSRDDLANNLIISDAIDYIYKHLSEKITLDDLSKVSKKISPQYFCRLFKKYTNMRPTEYIRKKRIEYAKQLLSNTDMPIYDIATACGFENKTYFYRCWKLFESEAPLEFRQQHSGIFI